MNTLLHDLRHGIRLLAKTPGFTAVAVLSLALGIGANTTVFSLMDAVMLRSLPIQNPEQLSKSPLVPGAAVPIPISLIRYMPACATTIKRCQD